MIEILKTPSQIVQNKITLWLNHLLVLYTFLISINNNAKSSLFFVILVLFLYRRDYIKYTKEVFSNKIVQACLLFYAINAFGMLYTDNIEYGNDHMDRVKYLLFPLIFLSFLDIRFVKRIIAACILGMFVSISFSYLVHLGIFPYELSIGKYEIWKTFAYSPAPFLSHGEHGVGIALVIAFLFYYILNIKDNFVWNKVIATSMILIALINMSFIASRTGYMTLIGVIVITVLLTYKENIKYLVISLFLFFIACFLLYSFSTTVNLRVDRAIDNFEKGMTSKKFYENGSTAQRIGLTLYSMEVIKENPIFGVGTGDHMDELRKRIPEEEKRLREISKPHNLYVQIPMQIGIIGSLSFIYLIYIIYSYKNTTREKKDILIITTTAVLVFMAGGMLYGTFELPLFMVIIAAMIATKTQNIEVAPVDRYLMLRYLGWVVLFLIIGITR